MKKNAMSLAEILLAMTIMGVLTIISIRTLKVNIGTDTNVMKFKHAYATFSQVIYELRNDAAMYPDLSNGFANTEKRTYPMETKKDGEGNLKSYEGETKFKELFKSKFSIFQNNINIGFDKSIPLAEYEDNSGNIEHTKEKTISCFMENKGFVYCPPDFTETYSSKKLSAIYVPLYVNKIDLNQSKTTDMTKIVFIKVYKTGKIELPIKVPDKGTSEVIIDCSDVRMNSYNHCKSITKARDLNF